MKTLASFIAISLSFQIVSAGVFLEPLKGTDKIYRGRAPRITEMKRVVDTGITSVLIFRNQIKTEVDDEISELVAAGIDRQKIYNIPFQWKDIASQTQACEQVIDALKILEKVENSSADKILFHCSVGEDRTGLLAGLMSQLLNTENAESGFTNQMCAKGYAGGNPHKPANVSAEVDANLTPLYFKMSKMIEEGFIKPGALNKKVCRGLEAIDIANSPKSCAKR